MSEDSENYIYIVTYNRCLIEAFSTHDRACRMVINKALSKKLTNPLSHNWTDSQGRVSMPHILGHVKCENKLWNGNNLYTITQVPMVLSPFI